MESDVCGDGTGHVRCRRVESDICATVYVPLCSMRVVCDVYGSVWREINAHSKAVSGGTA